MIKLQRVSFPSEKIRSSINKLMPYSYVRCDMMSVLYFLISVLEGLTLDSTSRAAMKSSRSC